MAARLMGYVSASNTPTQRQQAVVVQVAQMQQAQQVQQIAAVVVVVAATMAQQVLTGLMVAAV
jgi:hypothetical protein